jgi:heme-degrading monooxygenase HmoA
MIMRQWRGRVPREKAEEYLTYLQATGLEEYRSTPGNLGAFVTTRPLGKATEFLLVTFWESEEAVRRYAGDDYERAVGYPEDGKFLVAGAPAADHYQVKYAAHDFNKTKGPHEQHLLPSLRPLQRLGQSSPL